MTNQIPLLTVELRQSRRSRLTAFKCEHGIVTYRTPDMLRGDEPWIAVFPFMEDEGKTIGAMMAENCRLYDETGRSATGTGELTAIRKVCKQMEVKCPL